jgi:hypothetical protein
MHIEHDSDEWETKIDRRVCPFHERNPAGQHPGCTCSSGISSVRRDPAVVKAIKAKRAREREDAVLREAAEIIARRWRPSILSRAEENTGGLG